VKPWRLGQRAEVLGGEVAFEVFGEGPPVVLIHGTPSRSYIWRGVAPALAERFSVYVFDLLGYGDSEPRGDDVSIAAQARALRSSWGGGAWIAPPWLATT
jgi:pimeloyl-ACP methyl ester carboxylesterase